MRTMNTETDYWNVCDKGVGKNRNLWRNGGAWWISITLVNELGNRSIRRRFSLKTRDIEVARVRRDKIIAAINDHKGEIAI